MYCALHVGVRDGLVSILGYAQPCGGAVACMRGRLPVGQLLTAVLDDQFLYVSSLHLAGFRIVYMYSCVLCAGCSGGCCWVVCNIEQSHTFCAHFTSLHIPPPCRSSTAGERGGSCSSRALDPHPTGGTHCLHDRTLHAHQCTMLACMYCACMGC